MGDARATFRKWVEEGDLRLSTVGLRAILEVLAENDEQLPGNVVRALADAGFRVDAGGYVEPPEDEGDAAGAIYEAVPGLLVPEEAAADFPASFTFEEVAAHVGREAP
jgi:hypothetical protein